MLQLQSKFQTLTSVKRYTIHLETVCIFNQARTLFLEAVGTQFEKIIFLMR